MDVISMHQAGIDTAVCACGTALTPEQVRLISEYADEVILSYDSDEAGQKATLRSLELFRNSPVKVGVLQDVYKRQVQPTSAAISAPAAQPACTPA